MVQPPFTPISPLIAVTRDDDGTTTYVNSGGIVSIRVHNASSSTITWPDHGRMRTGRVATAAATLAAANPLFIALTEVGRTTAYYNAGLISDVQAATPSGTYVFLKASVDGGHGSPITVTESLATVQAAWNLAIASDDGSTTGTYAAAGATQGAATAITTSIARITSGSALAGVRLDAATAGERRWVHNDGTEIYLLYPATGESIKPATANVPLSLGVGDAIELVCTATGTWTREKNLWLGQVNGAGTTQSVTATVPQGPDLVTVVPAFAANSAATMYAAKAGMRVAVRNGSATVVARLFPFSGGTINSGAADAVYLIPPGGIAHLVCLANGAWTDEATQFDKVITNFILSSAPSANIDIDDIGGSAIARFSATGIIFSQGASFAGAADAAVAGGDQTDATQIAVNRFTITTCATLGDACVMSGTADISLIDNEGVAASFVYAPVGHTMDGVLDGFCIVPPGGRTLVHCGADGTSWYSTQLTRQTLSTTATLVAGAFTFNAGNIGAAYAARITASSFVRVNGISAPGAGTLGVTFLQTVVPGTSIAISAYSALGAADNTDVSTRLVEIVF